jgi:hypothetical protein
LYNIAAANVRGQISPALLTQAKALGGSLDERLWQDRGNAWATDTAKTISSLSRTAGDRYNHDYQLLSALEYGNRPDVIPLPDTPSFVDKVNALDSKIARDRDAYAYAGTQADKDAAKAQLLGPDRAQLDDLSSKAGIQGGFLGTGDIDTAKIDSLPEGDAQKAAYAQQAQTLRALLHQGGKLYDDQQFLDDLAHQPTAV